ncbi:hypothetical protein QZH41_017866, partial [Actinostola sp. cb2023]
RMKMNVSAITICIIYASITHVTSKFHCVGTCYSGRVFPKPEDIVHGKHLKGHSYKNITTDDPKKCYSSCVHDCRCKACQMKGARCELLDEDKTSKADDFVAESGYSYYDLKQELYKGKSHMVQPGVCYNGCCRRSQPCMNGGTCVEHCHTPKHKFTCTCPKLYRGKVCEKKLTSCVDVLQAVAVGQTPPNGVYNVSRAINGKTDIFPLYCAFSSPNNAWTGSLKMNVVAITICIIYTSITHVTSKFHCVGTCYSGRVFPKPEDIVHGKHLKGHSYKNITTDDPKKCYSSCVHDCRCKACQMKGARCELLDEDKTSKADDFVAESGYTYYDLKQEMYKGKSHMVQPGVCYNMAAVDLSLLSDVDITSPNELFGGRCKKYLYVNILGHKCVDCTAATSGYIDQHIHIDSPARFDRGNKMKMNVVAITICIIYASILTHVTSKFHCVGTCYSGRVFPKPEDIVHGKHLKGHSYKNITTDDPKKCYSSCVNDCRCKACQMKGARCELLDEDKTSKADDFVAESGYSYYDLKQEMYKGKSHMVQPGVCYNGCCRSQPCMNGGTCVEHCHTPKHKFTCTCPKLYWGKVCEKKLTSCVDVLQAVAVGQTPQNGVYNVYRVINGKTDIFPLYCAFSSPNNAWTLIESFSRANKDKFKTKPFYKTNYYNNYSPTNWELYRIGLKGITYIRTTATLFRATCDFPNRVGSLTPDFLLGNLSDVDITSPNELFDGGCKKYLHVNILGNKCVDCTAATYVYFDQHIHIDVSWNTKCDFRPAMQKSLDSFGYYDTYSNISKCTATQQSTTQWWLGAQK